MNGAPAPRRGSFLETWRLFASGTRWWMGVAAFLPVAIVALTARTPEGYFVVMGFMVAIWFAGSTTLIEQTAVARLAFMTLVPQPVESKWLVLAPNCAGAILAAAVTAVFGRMPAVSGLALLGCALWTIGAARWLLSLPVLLGIPVLVLAPVATYGAHFAGGWGAAAAAAMALGLGALAFQPPVVFDYASKPRPVRAHAAVRAAAPARREAVSRLGRERAIWLMSALRFLLVSTPMIRRFKVVAFFAMAALALIQPLPGTALFMLVMFLPSGVLSETYSRDKYEFLRPYPFSRGQRFVGGVVIPLFIALVVPTLMLAFVDLDWINHDGLSGRLFDWPRPHESTLSYLRLVVGATFLPETWPSGGLSADMWQRLRPLIYWEQLRVTAFIVAALFLGSHLRGAPRPTPWLVWANFPLQMLAVLAAMRASFGWSSSVPVPPLWFAVLLAVLAVAHWRWRARVVNAPDAPTGSSTPG